MFSKINLNILSPKERALLKEVSNEDLGKVRALVLEENVSVNIRDTLKRSPLMRAVVIDDGEIRKDVTSLLIEQGAEVNMVDLHGKSALMMACREEGKADAVRLLMECTRTDPNLQDEDGNTALIQAIEVEDVAAVQTLLDDVFSSRVDVNVENFTSKTAIVVATKLKNKEICVLLASTGKVNLSKVPKHLLSQMPEEAKREARISKSRLSKKNSNGTPTSKDAPYSFANQLSPSNSNKSFTIPTPIPDTEGPEDTRKEETKSPGENDGSPSERGQTIASDQSDGKSPEKGARRKESPLIAASSKTRSKSPPEKRIDKTSSPKHEEHTDRAKVRQDSGKSKAERESPDQKSRTGSRTSSKSRSKSPPEKQSRSKSSPKKQIAAEPPSPGIREQVEERKDVKQDSETSAGVEESPSERSQTRQEPRRVSSRMSTASFISEPPRPLNPKMRQRGWTAVPSGAIAANKWRQRTRERRADKSRSRPLRGKDQQPYVTKSGRMIHPNSVHDKKYEDIQETRALSRISRADMASQFFPKEDDARSVRSERPARESQAGRVSRVSKISIA